jgi:signal transduction histidine kinase
MSNRKSVRVLVVEPDPAVATLLVEALSLRAADFAITGVGTLADARAALRDQACDVALVELNLPDAHGLLTLARLHEERPALPVVVLTTVADEDMAISAIQQGAQDYLIKECVHYPLVSRSIRYAIERKRIEVESKAAKEAALAASAAKSEFLAHMSHEIRNPLTTIVNSVEILLEPEAPPSERFAAIDTIRCNGLHLLDVVNDILDICKIESRAFDVERIECSPTQIIAEVLDMFRVRARGKGVDLTVHWRPGIPVTIVSDPLRLKQILVNLVSNAIKFTERGEIRVDVQPLAGGLGHEPALQIAVSDTGIGITPARQQKLFVPYQQSDTGTTRQFGGSGLGLAISRELALKLGGDITIESTPGVGSTFTVRVATRAPQAARAKKSAVPYHAAGAAIESENEQLACKILLADDGPDNRRLLSTLLRRAGAIVDMVENGQHAIDAARRAAQVGQPYDVILMDLVMPQKDGVTATRELRLSGYDRPIIAVTARTGSGVREECLAAGFNDFTTKPLGLDTLLVVVRRWLMREPGVVVAG